MEQSQNCFIFPETAAAAAPTTAASGTTLSTTTLVNSTTNSSSGNNVTNTSSSSGSTRTSCNEILKILEQQVTLKPFTHTDSVDSMRSTTSFRSSLQSICGNSTLTTPISPIKLVPAVSNSQGRKKRLQRQKSTVYSGDETEYAADLEENDDDDDDANEVDEGYAGPCDRDSSNPASPVLPAHSNLSNQKKKQVRFRNKQQSESALQTKFVQHHHCNPIDKSTSSSSLITSSGGEGGSGCVGGIVISSRLHERRLKSDGSFDSLPELPHCSMSPHQRGILKRDSSVHSDSSRYSSVDSLLEARKPDPEAILLNLGFGPVGSEDILSRIPKRFLKPSQVRGIDTDAFIKRLQLANSLADHSVLGYRGLTGNPDAPPSHIVAKIMERFEVNERKKSITSMELKLR